MLLTEQQVQELNERRARIGNLRQGANRQLEAAQQAADQAKEALRMASLLEVEMGYWLVGLASASGLADEKGTTPEPVQ